MTANEIFELLKEEAEEGGAVIVYMAKPGDAITILMEGPPNLVHWALVLGTQEIQNQCRQIAADDINARRNGLFSDLPKA